ncbi:hypothetical protein RZS08_32610, partial [Arthrospira platensis SPKY1]|nr:hypothetical protein [Arthrospira platensis SPKY1]
MLEEIDSRVPEQADEYGLEFFVPEEDDLRTKADNCLEALKQGRNICCTHNLMYRFNKHHLEAIERQGYNVVSDEELNLINGYNLNKSDFDFLISNNLLSVDEDTGRVVFLDEDMSLNAKYGDVKARADLGMLYAAKRSYKFMV